MSIQENENSDETSKRMIKRVTIWSIWKDNIPSNHWHPLRQAAHNSFPENSNWNRFSSYFCERWWNSFRPFHNSHDADDRLRQTMTTRLLKRTKTTVCDEDDAALETPLANPLSLLQFWQRNSWSSRFACETSIRTILHVLSATKTMNLAVPFRICHVDIYIMSIASMTGCSITLLVAYADTNFRRLTSMRWRI